MCDAVFLVCWSEHSLCLSLLLSCTSLYIPILKYPFMRVMSANDILVHGDSSSNCRGYLSSAWWWFGDLETCFAVYSLSQGTELYRRRITHTGILAPDTSHEKVWKEGYSLRTLLCDKRTKYTTYEVLSWSLHSHKHGITVSEKGKRGRFANRKQKFKEFNIQLNGKFHRTMVKKIDIKDIRRFSVIKISVQEILDWDHYGM